VQHGVGAVGSLPQTKCHREHPPLGGVALLLCTQFWHETQLKKDVGAFFAVACGCNNNRILWH